MAEDDPFPLHKAAAAGDVDYSRTLVKCGYGINALNEDGRKFHYFETLVIACILRL
jgi:hypothetical protein